MEFKDMRNTWSWIEKKSEDRGERLADRNC